MAGSKSKVHGVWRIGLIYHAAGRNTAKRRGDALLFRLLRQPRPEFFGAIGLVPTVVRHAGILRVLGLGALLFQSFNHLAGLFDYDGGVRVPVEAPAGNVLDLFGGVLRLVAGTA